MKYAIVVILVLALAIFVSGCDKVADKLENETNQTTISEVENMNPTVLMKTNQGDIKIELFEDKMPITAGNFKKLVSEGFYDNLTFHRVIDNFMIQGGCPRGDGTGDPGYKIKDEFVDDPSLSNVRGTLAMANSGPNSGGSQFFINTVDNTYLDWNKPPETSKHPVFGKVIEGMDVVDAISKMDADSRGKPVKTVRIISVTLI